MSELEFKKVFVGNVPFQCTDDEFNECFKTLEGYVSSKLIKRTGSQLSRGFGYIEFETIEQTKSFIEDSGEINLKDRDLRFTMYRQRQSFDDGKFTTEKKLSNYKLFVDDLDDSTTKDSLKDSFSKYEDVVACFVNTSKGTNKKTGVVIFSGEDSYNDALENSPEFLKVKPFKKFNKSQVTDMRKVQNDSYNAGYVVGFQQGLNKGLNKDQNSDLPQSENNPPPVST